MARFWWILLIFLAGIQVIIIFFNISNNEIFTTVYRLSNSLIYNMDGKNSQVNTVHEAITNESHTSPSRNVTYEAQKILSSKLINKVYQAVRNSSDTSAEPLKGDFGEGISRVDKVYRIVQRRWYSAPGDFKDVKNILFWNTMYAEKFRDFLFGLGDIFEGCEVPHCYATPEREFFNSLENYDAILFHGIEMDSWDLPHKRFPHQRYVFVSLESTRSRPIFASRFILDPNFYNWTMTYRLDSDIVRPSRQITEIKTGKMIAPPDVPNGAANWRQPEKNETILSAQLKSIIEEKEGIAAWFVSNCNAESKRDDLVKNLQNYFKVDIYGQCGPLKCGTPHNSECYDMLEKKYFFYFSFENSLCEDYVTEKLFEPLSRYVIPVVYGGANYSQFAPPHSYINVNDFKTVKELAEYMIKLSKDPENYASYFWWKKYYRMEDSIKSTLCRLCEKLHDPNSPPKSIANFYEYYENKKCFPPNLPE